jgi:hypothetical protein
MFAIVANVLSDRVLRTGAKVWVCRCNGDAACPIVIGLSKSGRRITKYTHYKRLENFRAAWLPEHLRDDVVWRWDEKREATMTAEFIVKLWAGVRYYNRDGSALMRDGISEEAAFERFRRSVQY